MSCVLCGSRGKLSREHLWPQWARRTFDHEERTERIGHSIEDHTERTFRAWDARVFSATVKSVCEDCNNGWMSRLEARAKLHAEPLLLGRSCVLSSDAQLAISMWAYLKCLLFLPVAGGAIEEAMRPAFETFYALQEDDLLPLHVNVFTAYHIGPRQGQYQHRLLGKDPDRPELFVQTLTIRQLTVQIVKSYRFRGSVDLERHPAVAGADHRLWPVGPAFEWPPGPGLDDEGLTIYTGPLPRGGPPTPHRQ